MVSTSNRPNPVQASLIRLFDRPMEASELSQVQQLLMDYYSQLIIREADEIVARKNYTQRDFDELLNESQRTRPQ